MPNTQNIQHSTNPVQAPSSQSTPVQTPSTQAAQTVSMPQTTDMQTTSTQTQTQTESQPETQTQTPAASTPITDWSREISLPAGTGTSGQTEAPVLRPAMRSELAGSTGVLDMRNHAPDEIIETPTTAGEAYLGSMKSMLTRNKGNFVVATFLIGTQGTTTWEGILYEVGNDYLVIHQTGRDRYIACDMYSLKYIEFYDTQRKIICDNLLWQNG